MPSIWKKKDPKNLFFTKYQSFTISPCDKHAINVGFHWTDLHETTFPPATVDHYNMNELYSERDKTSFQWILRNRSFIFSISVRECGTRGIVYFWCCPQTAAHTQKYSHDRLCKWKKGAQVHARTYTQGDVGIHNEQQ